MKPFSKRAFIVVVLLQVIVLIAMIAQRVHLLETGQVVLLKCEPIDPRSLLSGDYVRLNYTISNFDQTRFDSLNPDKEAFQINDTVYVALEKPSESPFWGAVAVSHDLQKLKAKYPIVLRGALQFLYPYRIRYGVEQYFVPQYEGLRIEQALDKVSVEIAISDSGESGIKRLFIEGQEAVFY
ncbi:MAG: GDYXXLXY domain-containing protein [Nitrospira sp.]|nr:GDYXXLXY domain-containing protein [Nitrospira sp.]